MRFRRLLGWLVSSFLPSLLGAQDLVPLRDAAQIDAGAFHVCALTTAGGVKCWGANRYGQLGDGTTTFERRAPVDVVGLTSGVVAISAGQEHTCAIMTSGSVKCWGRNDHGQLGDGSTANRVAPVDVSNLGSDVSAISGGNNHTCAVTATGAAKCWGQNSSGQLGDGSTNSSLAPVSVLGLGNGVMSINAGVAHSCAVTSGGGAKCWGANFHGYLGDNSTTDRHAPVDVSGLTSGVAEISTGLAHTCARTTAGGVKCWGFNGQGQLGDNTRDQHQVPVDVVGLATGITSISVGNYHNCAKSTTGGVKCWGWNEFTQVGDGTRRDRYSPVDVVGLSSGVSAVAAGGAVSCAVTTSGGSKCWGANVGDGSASLRASPVSVSGLDGAASDISVGELHVCASTLSGGLQCWGANHGGQIGNNSHLTQSIPTDVSGLSSGVAYFNAGGAHTCAITSVGGVKCWGANYHGQLGDNSTIDRSAPVDVSTLSVGVTQVDTGAAHSCALIGGGAVKCWGYGGDGQLGNGINTGSHAPVDVVGLDSGVAAVSAGGFHSCALLANGGVKCWGRNDLGQLGDGSTNARFAPVDVIGLSDISAISVGSFNTCALGSNGGVKCWGGGNPSPTDVVGLDAGVTVISAGQYHNCALVGSEVKCWGDNALGQLGDGSTWDKPIPTIVAGLGADVVSIGAGAWHSCALTATGSISCWGWNFYGQLGNGGRNYGLPGDVLVDALASSATTDGDAASHSVASDASGRFLVFESNATTLSPELDSNGATDIYVRDLELNTTRRVSLDNAGGQISAASIEPSVSADGQRVVFVTEDAAVSKVAGESKSMRAKRLKSSTFGVYLRNMVSNSTFRASLGVAALPGGSGTEPTLSASGNAIIYTGLVIDPNMGKPGPQVIHVPINYAANGDPVVGQPRCVSCKAVTVSGQDVASTNADGESRNAVVSADGLWVAWESTAKNMLVSTPSPCPAASSEVYLRNLLTGASQRISAPSSPAQCGPDGAGARKPSMDWSGGKVVYESDQAITAGDRNSLPDVFLFDGARGQTTRISEGLDNASNGNGDSVQAAISGDGNVIAFRSAAKNFEPREPDDNETEDVYVRRLDQPLLRRVTRNRLGDQANQTSRRPSMNYNGTRIAFDSDATNLSLDNVTNEVLDANGVSDVFQVNNPTTRDIVFRSGF